MPTKSEIIEQLSEVTDKISSQVRAVSLGVLALTWGLLVGDSAIAKEVSGGLKVQLLGIGAAAIVVMFLDFLQYVAGYVNVWGVLREMESQKQESAKFDPKSRSYRARSFFFHAKQWVLGATVLWLLSVLGIWIVGNL